MFHLKQFRSLTQFFTFFFQLSSTWFFLVSRSSLSSSLAAASLSAAVLYSLATVGNVGRAWLLMGRANNENGKCTRAGYLRYFWLKRFSSIKKTQVPSSEKSLLLGKD